MSGIWEDYIKWDLENRISDGLEKNTDQENLLLGLVGGVTESAEALDIGKKLKWHHHPYGGKQLQKLLEELGDHVWYLSIELRFLEKCFPQLRDWAPDEIFSLIVHLNQKKLEARYSGGWTSEKSITREAEADLFLIMSEYIDEQDFMMKRTDVVPPSVLRELDHMEESHP